jgi:hypothetical protein
VQDERETKRTAAGAQEKWIKRTRRRRWFSLGVFLKRASSVGSAHFDAEQFRSKANFPRAERQ